MGILDALRGSNSDAIRHSTSVTMTYLLEQNRKFEAFMRQKVEELDARVAAQQARLSALEVNDLAEAETLLPDGDEVAVLLEDLSGELDLLSGPSEVELSELVTFETRIKNARSGQAETAPETTPPPQDMVLVSDTLPLPASGIETEVDRSSSPPPTTSPPEPQDWLAALVGPKMSVAKANAAVEGEGETQSAATYELMTPTTPTRDEVTGLPVEPTNFEAATSNIDGPPTSTAPPLIETGPSDHDPTFIPSWMQVSPSGKTQPWQIHETASVAHIETLLVETRGENNAGEPVSAPAATGTPLAEEKAGEHDDDDGWETPLNDGPLEDWG